MTLEEAIEHCKSIACETSDCGMEHAQLAEWLEELKQRREQEEPIREDLEEAAKEYSIIDGIDDIEEYARYDIEKYNSFKDGAKWQKAQKEK